MKQYLTLIAFSFLVISLFAANNSGIASEKKSIDNHNDTSFILENDTLHVVVTQNKVSVKSSDWQKNMPWVGAVLVGILTVIANILISKQSRKSNREVTEKQLNNTKEIALAHIENTRNNVQMDFNKTVLSGNRQAWINDLRELISKILSSTMSVSMKQNLSQQEFENLRFLITKVELMLNATKDKDFVLSLTELENCCLEILMQNKKISDLKEYSDKVKHHTQTTLKTEWERVKKGE